jgi:hypothetical protein
MRKQPNQDIVLIKPIWWRQAFFTLFLLVVTGFFAVVTSFGPVFSWVGTIVMGLMTLLSFLDQIFEWSRLKIDHRGYSLRGWFRNQMIEHHEIDDFKIDELAGKKLLTVVLQKHALKARKLPYQPVPFPCTYGQPIEEVLKIIRSQIDRTPRPRISK